MWWEITKAVMFVGSVIYQWSNKPKVKKPKPDKAKAKFPRSEEGSGISVVFGYAYIDDCIVPWYKYEGASEITFEVPMLGTTEGTGRCKHYITVQDVICLSNIDAVEMIFLNNEPNRSDWNSNLSSPEYYGWEDNADFTFRDSYPAIGSNEYNFDKTPTNGNVSLAFGASDQAPDAFLETATEQGTTISAYRGVVQCIKKRILIGIADGTAIPQLIQWQYLVKRLLKQHDGTAQWYDTKVHCGYGMNVVHAIRELIVSERIGAGLSSTLIDSTTFEDCADTCYTEGRGVSFHYSNTDGTVGEMIEELLSYAQGTLYFDMGSTTFKIKLWRNDYTYATLDEITRSDFVSINNINKREPSSVVNDCTVVYTDRYTFGQKVAAYKDEASISEIGRNPETIDMKWTMNPELASLIAMQTVVLSSAQLTSCELTGPLELDKYNPGDVFKLTDSRYGWNGIVFRVIEKERSELNGESITLSILEDYFGIGLGAFGDGTVTPIYTPLDDVDDPIVQEMPYFLNTRIYEDPDDVLGESVNHVMTMGKNPASYTGYGIHYKLSTDSDYTNYGSGYSFAGVVTLKTAIGMTDSDFETNEGALPFTVGFAVIGDEIVKIYTQNASLGTFSAYRGMHDTLPASHSADVVIYLFKLLDEDSRYGVIQEDLALGSTYNIKLASESITGSQNPADATANNITISNRSIMPYPPANVKANYGAYEDDGTIWIGTDAGTILSWYHRNRLTQYDQWLRQNNESLTPEFQVAYYIRIYDSTGTTLKRTELITGGSGVTSTNISSNSSIHVGGSLQNLTWNAQDITNKFQVGDSVVLANFSNAGNNSTRIIDRIEYYPNGSGYTYIWFQDTTGIVNETLTGLDETITKDFAWTSEYDYTDTLETADFGSLQSDKIVKLKALRPKLTSPYVFTNDDATSSIIAATGTIVFVGQDLTAKVKVGYTIILANFTESGNNSTRIVATVSESGGNSTITVTDNTGMVDETLTDITTTPVTLSVTDYWESWQEWDLHVKRLTAPTVAFDEGLIYDSIDPSTDYEMIYENGDGFYYEYTYATAPAEPSEPSDPTTGSSFNYANLNLEAKINNYRYKVKIMAKKNGQLSPIGSGQNYT